MTIVVIETYAVSTQNKGQTIQGTRPQDNRPEGSSLPGPETFNGRSPQFQSETSHFVQDCIKATSSTVKSVLPRDYTWII